jgi:uncharacterized protein YkwD
MRAWPFALLLVGGACSPRGDAPARSTPEVASAAPPHAGSKGGARPPVAAAAVEPGADPARSPEAKWLTPAKARAYMVELINRDRATAGLAPVVLDDGAPTHAGQAHADDMAARGYLGHWGSDGSVPEERLTEAGSADMVQENASCFTDEQPRKLDRAPLIDPKNVEQAEDMFFHETPPHDGHRKNILKPWHKRVGIGIAQPVATPTEIPTPCFAQEFIDPYGSYRGAPHKAKVGEVLHVGGSIAAPAVFAGVGLARTDAPVPIPVAELNRRRTYPVPAPYQMYWPPGFKTPIPVKVTGSDFAIDVPLSDGGKPGLYELSVWATMPGSSDFVMVSLRTIQVRP